MKKVINKQKESFLRICNDIEVLIRYEIRQRMSDNERYKEYFRKHILELEIMVKNAKDQSKVDKKNGFTAAAIENQGIFRGLSIALDEAKSYIQEENDSEYES